MIKSIPAQQCLPVDAQRAVTCEQFRIKNRQRNINRLETGLLIMALSLTNQWKHWNMKTREWCRFTLRQLLLQCNHTWPFKATSDIAADNEDVKWAENNVQGGFNVPFILFTPPFECNRGKLSNNRCVFFSPLVTSATFNLGILWCVHWISLCWSQSDVVSLTLSLKHLTLPVPLISSFLILSIPPFPLLFTLLLTRWFSTGGLYISFFPYDSFASQIYSTALRSSS